MVYNYAMCQYYIKDNDTMPQLFDPNFTRLRGMGYFNVF